MMAERDQADRKDPARSEIGLVALEGAVNPDMGLTVRVPARLDGERRGRIESGVPGMELACDDELASMARR
jgi:hypothetical protein